MTTKLLVGYLTSNRRFMLNQMCEQFNKISYPLRVHVMVLYNGSEFDDFKSCIDANLTIDHSIINVANNDNYLTKINSFARYAIDNGYTYCMKLDNDIFINHFMIDYLVENMHLLDDDQNLVLTPNLSNGIPSCDNFMDDFFTEDEKHEMGNLFRSYQFINMWGFDYAAALNRFTINADHWSATEFYEGVRAIDHHFKGVHPIRMSRQAIMRLNEIILSKKELYQQPQNFGVYVNNSPYLCNSVFIIRSDVYSKILADRSLYVDNYDEVPVNKYCDKHNLNKLFVKNSFTIHMIYNTIPNHDEHERWFYAEFMG